MKFPNIAVGQSFVILSAGLFFVLALFGASARAQDDTIRVDTNLVSIPVTVLPRDGKYLGSLKESDFEVYEDGVLQKVEEFSAVEEPVTIIMVLDIGPLMRDYYGSLLVAANSFVKQLKPNDRLMAISFHDRIDTVIELTEVKNIGTGIKLKPKTRVEGIVLFDAVDFAIKKLKRISGRKALVLFSTGIGTGIVSSKSTLRAAEEGDAAFYTVQFGKFAFAKARGTTRDIYFAGLAEIEGYMRNLALKTGGRPYNIEDIADLSQTFHQIALELSQQYRLGYYPTKVGKDGERRKITVRVKIPNVAVRSRSEVIYKKPKK